MTIVILAVEQEFIISDFTTLNESRLSCQFNKELSTDFTLLRVT